MHCLRMVVRVIPVACLALSGAASAQSGSLFVPAQAVCSAGQPICCPSGVPGVIPETRNLTMKQATAALRKAGFKGIRTVSRPSDGTPSTLVMATNPYSGTSFCTSTPVILYVANVNQVTSRQLGNFRGYSVSEARERLVGGLQQRISFSSCGAERGSSFADPRSVMVVSEQYPPEGARIDDSWSQGILRLIPREEFWNEFVGLTLRAARARLQSDPVFDGWSISSGINQRENGSAPIDDQIIASASGDRKNCRVWAMLTRESVANSPKPPASAVPSDSDGVPISPGLPLAGGLIGGWLLARAFWPRGHEVTGAYAIGPKANQGPVRIRLRVRHNTASVPIEPAG